MTMGSVGRNTVVAFLMIAAMLQSANAAATLTVGGTTGWTLGITPTFYDDWAKSQTFAVGDTLAFDYSSDIHNVYEVTAADLASCTLNAPLKTYLTSGGASVPISTAGNHYYICGIPGHCLANMQMSIVVPGAAPASPPIVPLAPAPAKAAPAPAPTKAAPAPAPSKAVPAPAPSKKAPAPAPAKTPSTTPVVAGPVAAPGPAPSTSKGYQSAGPAMIVGVVLCFVTCFLSL